MGTLVIPTPSAALGASYARNERSGGISRVVGPAEIPRLRSQAHSARDDRAAVHPSPPVVDLYCNLQRLPHFDCRSYHPCHPERLPCHPERQRRISPTRPATFVSRI